MRFFFEYGSVNDNLIINHKYSSCNKNYSKKNEQNLKDWFKSKLKFSNDINKFILLLKKGVRIYEFMGDFIVTRIRKILQIHITVMQKKCVEILKIKF